MDVEDKVIPSAEQEAPEVRRKGEVTIIEEHVPAHLAAVEEQAVGEEQDQVLAAVVEQAQACTAAEE